MKKGIFILACALALGACMFVCTRFILARMDEASMPVEAGSRLPELQWLRHWLDLNDEQFSRVKALHIAYLPKCEQLCERVHESNASVLALSRKQFSVDPAFAAAIQARAQLTSECQQALLQHIYETAACLKPEQANRYLHTMVPHALGVSCCATPSSHKH